jgi:hypothetical protein
MGWEEQVGKLFDRQKKNMSLFYKKVAFDVFTEIVLRTPVDTGRARANWVVTIDQPNETEVEGVDKSGTQAMGNGLKTINRANEMPDFWITNNLPYIEKLEFGGSRIKAPAGMVRVTVARWREFLEDNKDELDK